jgi:hypothetical protein
LGQSIDDLADPVGDLAHLVLVQPRVVLAHAIGHNVEIPTPAYPIVRPFVAVRPAA